MEGSLFRERCIQHWTSRAGSLPPEVEAAWGDRLYGCDSCTESCPRFKGKSTIRPRLGLLGRGLSAARIAVSDDAELRVLLKGSALGLSWIEPEALRRSATLILSRRKGAGQGGKGVFDSISDSI
jgi:epoxyqueuosine reductase